MAKLMFAVAAALSLTGVLASAQEVERKSKTKITVEEGREITVTGCVARRGDD